MRVEALSIVRTVGKSLDSFLLKYKLNPVIFPFLEPNGGSSQDAKILVEVIPLTVNPLGAFEGTGVKQTKQLKPSVSFIREINQLVYRSIKRPTNEANILPIMS